MTQMMRMFPLGSVLFPHTIIPLHIFEARYVQMIEECIAREEPFGVVLIERGFEVGGGDARFSTGTAARIIESVTLDDGRMAIAIVGTERILVERWCDDDPYPRAEAAPFPDQSALPSKEALDETERLLRRLLGLLAELGTDVGSVDFEISVDPTTAAYQLCSLAPIGQLDAQHLLEAASPEARIALLDRLLVDATELVERQLS